MKKGTKVMWTAAGGNHGMGVTIGDDDEGRICVAEESAGDERHYVFVCDVGFLRTEPVTDSIRVPPMRTPDLHPVDDLHTAVEPRLDALDDPDFAVEKKHAHRTHTTPKHR